jgi:hypothetical protein
MKIYPFGTVRCPHCGADRNRFASGTLLAPRKASKSSWWVPWFLREESTEEIEEECLEFECLRCDGTFRTRTFDQQSDIGNLRPYDDRNCPGCGAALNRTDATTGERTHPMDEKIVKLFGVTVIRASCYFCDGWWHMKTHERTLKEQQVGAGITGSPPVVPEEKQPEPERPVQGLVDLVPEIKTERPLH